MTKTIRKQVELTEDQINGLLKLIQMEIITNKDEGNDAYNPWWIRIRTKLLTEIVKNS